jgi:hypothetical protein
MRMFTFDPADYAEAYATKGFVHIMSGLTREYLQSVIQAAEENMKAEQLMKQFAIGDKQQAKYELPSTDHYEELRQTVGRVMGAEPNDLILSERHFKSYEKTAIPDPPAHKDRFASEISVGFSVHVEPGSTLVLYPQDYNDTNPFNSSGEMSVSYSPERSQNQFLKTARRVEIADQPGDVVMFRGNKIWHLRARPAGTTMLYLKMNSFNCDPLGEDPTTPPRRAKTQEIIGLSDEQLADAIPHIGRRVDYFHRRISREMKELNGAVLYGEKHFTLDDDELRGIRAMDGKRNVKAIVAQMASSSATEALAKIRRMAARGVIDLTPDPSRLAGSAAHGQPVAATR